MKRKITVRQAAMMMGKCEQFVRVGLQREILPFGVAIKMSSMWTYYINPKDFYEYLGKELPEEYR